MKATRLIATAAAALLSIAAPAAAAPDDGGRVVVRVAAQSSVRGGVITLGDVSRFDGVNADSAAALSSIRLGISPMPGSWRELDRELISTQLRQSGYGDGEVRLECPAVVRVWRESQTVTQAQLERRLRDYIYANAPLDPEEIDIRGISRVGDQLLPAGELSIFIRPRDNGDFRGPTPFSVELLVDGQEAQRIVMQAEISVYRDVVVAAAPIPAQSVISASDVEVRRVDISSAQGKVFCAVEEVEGKAATTYLRPGQIVTARAITLPILVRRGQAVQLEARRPGFIISTSGIAQRDGREGEVIPVLNTSSRVVIEAEVVGPQRARVIF